MNKSARGFTLIEILMVISIIAIITATLIPSFDSYIKNQNLKQGQEAVKNDLRTMQNRAMTGADSGDGVKYWGIYFAEGTNKYTFISSTLDSPTCVGTGTSSDILPGDVVLDTGAPGSSKCVWFAIGTGDAFIATETDVHVKSGTSATTCKRVNINKFGRIFSDPGSVSCP